MRSLLLLFIAFTLSFSAKAAPGDTTWVQAHNGVWLDWYNNFDTTIKFPDGSVKYRKIIMVFTLGKYACPGSPTYCSDWDYTVQTFAMNKAGDTVELGRLITPYGKGSRMPASWQQPFYFDVSDYSTVLKDSNKIRVLYSGYSGGFTANIRFALIEGTPERDVIGVKSIWDGGFSYGDPADPIDGQLGVKTLTAPAGTIAATYRLNITGHGFDLNGCSEFCQKYYRVLKDGALVKEKSIWRDNCGLNNLYPQSGTWIYNRGNWCPGDLVHTLFHPLPGITAGSTYDLSMAFQPYTWSIASTDPSYPSYTINGAVVYYGAMNKALDASVEDIIAPTTNQNYFRENARIGLTTIKVRNTGSTVINNIEFEYGVSGQPLSKTFWTGTIQPLTDTIIDLPNAASLFTASGTNIPYEVTITKVNFAVDEDFSNNKFVTAFNPVAEWPAVINITLLTNKATTSAAVSETEWQIMDGFGKVVAQRINNAPSSSYKDTITLPTGNYKLSVSDAGCDGLSFWANSAAGSGSLVVRKGIISIPLPGYFGGDFGCGFVQYFRVGSPTSIETVNLEEQPGMLVYPNPAQDFVKVEIDGVIEVKGLLNITDNIGRVVSSIRTTTAVTEINIADFNAGLYFINFIPEKEAVNKMTQKLVILK